MPTVLMLTSIASARNGERIVSITTDVTFLVVLAFIRFVCSTHLMRGVSLRDGMTLTTGVPVVHVRFFWVCGPICRPQLTTARGPKKRGSGSWTTKFAFYSGFTVCRPQA